MVNLWAERGVYSQATAESFSLEMLTGQGAAAVGGRNEKQPSSVHAPSPQFTRGAGAHVAPPGSDPPPPKAPWIVPNQERYAPPAAYGGAGPFKSHPPATVWGGAGQPIVHGAVRAPVSSAAPPPAQTAVLAYPQPWQSHPQPWAAPAGAPYAGSGSTHLQPPMQAEPAPAPPAPPAEPQEEPFDPMSFPPGESNIF